MTEARVTSLADGAGHTALRGLPAVWLRANCPCADCRDPGSGQRLVAVTDLPADVTVAGVPAPDGAVEVIFGPGGHRAGFSAGWPAPFCAPGGAGAARQAPAGHRDHRAHAR